MNNIEKNRTAIRKYKEYNFWCDVKLPFNNEGLNAKDYIIEYLKNRFPNCIILGQYAEFNNIDLYVVEEKLPIEIQSTIISKDSNPSLSTFEKLIRKQIEENIKTLEKCWFFFDEDLLKYLQNGISLCSSMQLDWLYSSMKNNKLTIFTMDHKGNIKERCLEDFSFIPKISTTCEVGKENDARILERNKYDILKKLINFYGIKQSEIDKYGKEFKDNRKYRDFRNFMIHSDNDRMKKFGHALNGLGHLDLINSILDGHIADNDYYYAKWIDMFESEGLSSSNKNRIRFVDYPKIAAYFPAYIRNKDKWDKFKGQWLTPRQLEGIIEGKFDYDWYKKLEDKKDHNDNLTEFKNNNIYRENIDKEINIEIKNDDQIINIKIKDNTRQKNIEDAWNMEK